jgi:hypothetical protein
MKKEYVFVMFSFLLLFSCRREPNQVQITSFRLTDSLNCRALLQIKIKNVSGKKLYFTNFYPTFYQLNFYLVDSFGRRKDVTPLIKNLSDFDYISVKGYKKYFNDSIVLIVRDSIMSSKRFFSPQDTSSLSFQVDAFLRYALLLEPKQEIECEYCYTMLYGLGNEFYINFKYLSYDMDDFQKKFFERNGGVYFPKIINGYHRFSSKIDTTIHVKLLPSLRDKSKFNN